MLHLSANVSDAHNELGSTLLLACIITGKYVVHYITLLFQKVILLCNMLLGVNLVANVMLLCYVTRYFLL